MFGRSIVPLENNVVLLSQRSQVSTKPSNGVEAAVARLKKQPIKRVNWVAVHCLMGIGTVGMLTATFMPPAASSGVKWAATVVFFSSLVAWGAAVLYRYAPAFWVVRMPKNK